MSIPGIWIVVIFALIAVTLASMLFMVYSFISREEMGNALNEQVAVLSDTADNQILNVMRNQYLLRLASREDAAACIADMAGIEKPTTESIRNLMAMINQVKTVFPIIDRVDIYFPKHAMVVGSTGVYFMHDKKYIAQGSPFDDLPGVYPADALWVRRVLMESGAETAYISCLRMYSGIFDEQIAPMVVVSIAESKLHAQLRSVLRTMKPDDAILLSDHNGIIFSAEDAALIGTALPTADSAFHPVTLENGRTVHIAEMISDTLAWHYVLAREGSGRIGSYGDMLSFWIVMCVALLIVGLVSVLLVMMKHYSRPMQRLMTHLDQSDQRDGGGLLSSPSASFLQIEYALSDMETLRSEREAFIEQSRPVLRESWLNCFIRGEAHYTQAQPQLEIAFPHPNFQVAFLSRKPSGTELACIQSVFDAKIWTVAVFETPKAETVFLTNHGQDEHALPRLLTLAIDRLPPSEDELFFGVGLLAETEDRTAISFRCARRVLSERYYDKEHRVYVFDPNTPHGEADSVIPSFAARMTAIFRHLSVKPMPQIEREVRLLMDELRGMNSYLDTMRSIMLFTAAALSKPAYDAQITPESLYGENIANAYYHITDIQTFAERLIADIGTLQRYYTRKSNDSNRSVIQYAIHHIRSAPPAELSIKSIADALSISISYLSRMFHQETGRKLVDYLQEVRMEHAARLLTDGVLSNDEICEAVGYSRLQYFAAKFKERYGLTLNEYRAKVRRVTEDDV
jgi:AraC-like DNA-binding protein